MELTDRCLTYADCGVVPDPDEAQLAEIAIASANSHQQLTGEEPRVAMLQFFRPRAAPITRGYKRFEMLWH